MSARARGQASLVALFLVALSLPIWWRVFYRPMPAFAFTPPIADLNVKLIRAGLDAKALAVAGLTTNNVSALATAANTYVLANPVALSQADQDYATARKETDRLQALIQSGHGSQDDVSNYQTQSTALANATAARQAALDALFNAATANLSQGQKTTLTTIRANRALSDASLEFLTVNRSQQEWVDLRDCLANERIAVDLPDTLDQGAQAQLATWRAVESVATAKTSLDTNLAGVTSTWNSSTSGN